MAPVSGGTGFGSPKRGPNKRGPTGPELAVHSAGLDVLREHAAGVGDIFARP
jgi:hypothetical protein